VLAPPPVLVSAPVVAPPPVLVSAPVLAPPAQLVSVPSSGYPSTTRVLGPPPLEAGQHFSIDPVADGVLIAGGASFSILLSLILGTGEIKPPLPGPTSNLLSIDRVAVTQTIDPNASTIANAILYGTIGFAVLDPVLSGFRDGWDALEVDGVMYAETISLTEMLTDITKIAVRRPRPIDYIDCPYQPTKPNNGQTGPACQGTDLGLSFFSGHASTVGSIGATATYLAFVRSGKRSVRPWITLVASTALTAWVSYERVRSGAHFPTDVIAGSFAGVAVGVLVPHLHLHPQEAPSVLLGAAPVPGGSELTISGTW
jgi:membrane-associated phospholipid phosphatase